MFFHLGLTNNQHYRNISLVHWIESRYADSQADFLDKDSRLKPGYYVRILLRDTAWVNHKRMYKVKVTV